jgi:hypothetical protein
MPVLNFTSWTPDTNDLNAKGVDTIRNVLWADGSCIPFPQLVELTAALESEPFGAFTARALDGTVTVFVGTATKLWRLDNTTLTWTDVSQAATTYGATNDERWDFEQFGDNVIAVNANDDPQVYSLTSSSAFADLGGSPPRARKVKVWGDFLALMGLTSNLDRVHWSGLNDITNWTPGVGNSDYQTFPDGGIVQSSTSATNPIIFLERAVWAGTFVPGSVEIFTFRKIHDKRGAKSASSIASRGAYAFFADEGGFFQIGPDGSLGTIGFEKVDRTIFGRLSSPDAAKIAGVVDPFYSRVYWAVDFAGTGDFDTLIVYDWNLQKWTQADESFRLHFPAATLGQTLEGLGNLYPTLEEIPLSLDSKAWQGGAPVLAAFNSENKLCFFSGEPKEASITTQEMGDEGGQMSRITSMFPIVDSDDVKVSIGSRIRRSDPVTWTTEAGRSTNTGRVHKKARARFHRLKVRIPAGSEWTHARGVEVDVSPAGFR